MTVKSLEDAASIREQSRLPNGARLIAFEYDSHAKAGVVLARMSGAQPYVTWKFYNKDFETTTMGYYFNSFGEAAANFEDRARAL